MIYTLTVECVNGAYLKEECICVIEIDENASLYDLHRAINDAVEFDYDHIYDFYAGRHPRNRKIWFSEKEEWEEREDDYCNIVWCPRLSWKQEMPKQVRHDTKNL